MILSFMHATNFIITGYVNILMKDSNFRKLIGKWKYNPPWDDFDDCRSEYEISGSAEKPMVKAIDFYDSEEFIVSNISWNSQVLEFESFMKSTGRKGINKFILGDDGLITNEFTFTESGKLTKIK